MSRKSPSIARLYVAALGAALAVSVPTGAVAENWIGVLDREDGSTLCVDRDSVRWEGFVVHFAAKLCATSNGSFAGIILETRFDCAQDPSQAFVDIAYLDVDGNWRNDRADSAHGLVLAARAVCQGL